MTTAKERLWNEIMEVTEKRGRLEGFRNNNPGWKSLSEVQKGLLYAQRNAMETYEMILRLRYEMWEDIVP